MTNNKASGGDIRSEMENEANKEEIEDEHGE